MTPDPYRKAYDKALEDLTSISETFEQLRARKKLVENAIAALQPVCASPQQNQHGHAVDATPDSGLEASTGVSAATEEGQDEPANSYSFLAVPSPLPDSDGDPFQRRARGNFRFRGLSTQRSV